MVDFRVRFLVRKSITDFRLSVSEKRLSKTYMSYHLPSSLGIDSSSKRKVSRVRRSEFRDINETRALMTDLSSES